MKIDFHVHTKSNKYLDRAFDYDENSLRIYASSNHFDCLAITNHNLFDEKQFLSIKGALNSIGCEAFPGMEVSLEGGHILVIGDHESAYYEKLTRLNDYIADKEKNDHFRLDVATFNEFIKPDYGFLLIPHYKKEPHISAEVIDKIATKIYVGEAQSPKKFYFIQKEGIYTPVLFSDIRIFTTNEDSPFRDASKYTYLDCTDKKFSIIKTVLRSKNSTSLTKEKANQEFEILNGEAIASTGINVLLGRRSSGKTYTLDHVYGEGNNHTLYIRQFEIMQECDDKSFKANIDSSTAKEKLDFIKPLNQIFDYLDSLNYPSLLEEYESSLKSLHDSAQQNINDSYSQVPLFHTSPIKSTDMRHVNDDIKAVDQLLSDKEEEKLINQYLSKERLMGLYYSLLEKAKKAYKQEILILKTNEIVKTIASHLAGKSSKIQIKPFDFTKLFAVRYARAKFNSLVSSIDYLELPTKSIFNKFKLTLAFSREKDLRGLKSSLKVKQNGNVSFLIKEAPFDAYFQAVSSEEIPNKTGNDRYKFFFSFKSKVTGISGEALSGGQRAEFILLEKLSQYRTYDTILIDEMESSFDNPFLNSEIVDEIKKMSKDATVFISTHNNNLGVSLNPDYYVYHEIRFDPQTHDFIHNHFYGSSSSEFLISSKGEKRKLSEILMTTMEANEKAYDERRQKYENS